MLAAFYNSTLPRLIPIGMVLLALQKTAFVELQFFDVVLQLLLAFTATAGAVGGPNRGAVTGFVLGIMFDLSVGSPLGSSAITMGLAGVIAGWLDVIRIETKWFLIVPVVGVAAGIGELGVPVVRFLIGDRNAFVAETPVIVLVVAASSALLSIPFAPVARWVLGVDKSDWRPDKVKGSVVDESD